MNVSWYVLRCCNNTNAITWVEGGSALGQDLVSFGATVGDVFRTVGVAGTCLEVIQGLTSSPTISANHTISGSVTAFLPTATNSCSDGACTNCNALIAFPTPTPTNTPTFTPSPTPTPTLTPTVTPTPISQSETWEMEACCDPADKILVNVNVPYAPNVYVFYDATSLSSSVAAEASESIRSWFATQQSAGEVSELYEGVIGKANNNGENWLWWLNYPYLGSLTGGTLSDSTAVTEINQEVQYASYDTDHCSGQGSGGWCIPRTVNFNDGIDIYQRINRGYVLTGTYGVNDSRTNGVPFNHGDLNTTDVSGPGTFNGGDKNYIVINVVDEADGTVGLYHGVFPASTVEVYPFGLFGTGWSTANPNYLYDTSERFEYDYEQYLKVWEDIKIQNGRVNALVYPVITGTTAASLNAKIPMIPQTVGVVEGETLTTSEYLARYGENMDDVGPEDLNLTALTYNNIYTGFTSLTAYQNLNPSYQNGPGLKNFGVAVDPSVTGFTESFVASKLNSFLAATDLSQGLGYTYNGTCYEFTQLSAGTPITTVDFSALTENICDTAPCICPSPTPTATPTPTPTPTPSASPLPTWLFLSACTSTDIYRTPYASWISIGGATSGTYQITGDTNIPDGCYTVLSSGDPIVGTYTVNGTITSVTDCSDILCDFDDSIVARRCGDVNEYTISGYTGSSITFGSAFEITNFPPHDGCWEIVKETSVVGSFDLTGVVTNEFNDCEDCQTSTTPLPTTTPSFTPTPTNTPTNTVTPSSTVTVTPTITPSNTVTVTPTLTNTPTVTPSITSTPGSTVSPTPSITASVTPSITSSVTPSVTATVTVTPSVTTTPGSTVSPTPSITASVTPSITSSVTPSVTATVTVTPSITTTPGGTPSPTPSITASVTPSNTASVTPSVTATVTVTPTITSTPGGTPSMTPTITPSITSTPAATPSLTPTNTPTPTITPSITPSNTTNCVEATTNGTFFYTDCCGFFVAGQSVGDLVLVDSTEPYSGIVLNGTPATQNCDQGDLDYSFTITGTCEDASGGAITISPTGGVPPYTIDNILPGTLPGGTSNQPFTWTGLSSGTYTFRLNDSLGDSNSEIYINVNIDGCMDAIINDYSGTTCGNDNGFLSVSGDSTSLPYLINLYQNSVLYNSQSSSINPTIYYSLPDGDYYATIEDYGGATAQTQTVTISGVSTLDFGLAVTGTSACGMDEGAIAVTGLTGTPPYTYLWSNGETGSSISGLSANTYYVTVTDANGCSLTDSATITIAGGLDLLAYAITPSACLANDGEVTVFISGGTAPYTYLGSNGQTYTTSDTTYTFTGVSSGAFTVTINDTYNCQLVEVLEVPSEGGIDSVSISTIQTNCGNDATMNITIQGNGSPFTYSYTGQTNGSSDTVTKNGKTHQFTGLSADTYDVRVESADGCCYTTTVTVTTNPKFSIDLSTSGETCGLNNGAVTITVNSGYTGVLDYILSDGQQIIDYGYSAYTFTNLDTGLYSITVTDSQNCSVTENFNITGTTGVIVSLTKEECTPSTDAQITANVIQGVAPYTYLWSDGQTGSTATGLTAGEYSVIVEDASGCTDSDSIEILCTNQTVSNYQLVTVCEDTFTTTYTKRSIYKMLNDGYLSLVADLGASGCTLDSAVFNYVIEYTGTTYEDSFYTGYTLNDYPSDNLWASTLETALLGIPGIQDVDIDVINNTIVITGECSSNQTITINMRIDYDLTCSYVPISPTPTPTVTPTPTDTPAPSPDITATPIVLSTTPTPTPTQTPVFSVTPTVTPTVTPSVTNTITPTITPTNSITPTITPTNTVTPTPSVSIGLLCDLVVEGSYSEGDCLLSVSGSYTEGDCLLVVEGSV